MKAKSLALSLRTAASTLAFALFLAACGGGQGPAMNASPADTSQAALASGETQTTQVVPGAEQVTEAAQTATTETADGSWKWTGIKPNATTYALTVAKAGSGSISSLPAGIACGTDCSETYASGTTVTLTAAPASGYTFKGWSGACAGTSLSCTVSMTAARSATATFESVPIAPTTATYTLSVNKSGSGTVNSSPAGISCGTDCSEPYATGTSITLTATPASGSTFKGWSGACTGTSPNCSVSMTAERSVTATFETSPTGPVSSTPEPVDSIIAAMPPNSWKALPATQMRDVCPTPYHSGACTAVVSAWSGAAYDESRDRMVVQGGGHADSWYNNIFAFDLGPMKWRRLTEMGAGSTGSVPGSGWTDKRVETCGFYPKGVLNLPLDVMSGEYVAREKCFTEPVLSQLDLQQPRSAHTYGNLFVDKSRDRYCNVSRTFYPSAQASSQVAVCYSPTQGTWSRIADRPLNAGPLGQSALDASGNVWLFSGSQGVIAKYEPAANIWKTFGNNNGDAGGGMDIDRSRNHVFVVLPKSGGGHTVRRWDLNMPTSLSMSPNYTDISTTGDLPTALGNKPGFVYVDARDRFFAWGGGRDVYTFSPATNSWQRHTASGDDPGAQQGNGTFGRFRYSPTRGVFVLVNSTTQDVFIYKPAS